MENGINRLTRIIFFFTTLLFLMGCASEPVPIDWPANHPANPDAEQATYSPAINPFQDTVSMHEVKPTEGASMPHGGHMERHTPEVKPNRKSQDKSNEIKTEQSDHSH